MARMALPMARWKNSSNYIIGTIDLCGCKIESCFRPIKKSDEGLYELFDKIIEHYLGNSKIRIDVDFNPSQML